MSATALAWRRARLWAPAICRIETDPEPGTGRVRNRSSAEEPRERVAGDVARDLRVLLQAPQRVAVPLAPEGDVDAQTVARLDEFVRTPLAHAEQHLELVLLRRQPIDALKAPLDQPLVVRRDPDIRTRGEQ